jgi:stage IV sporulation protein FB
MSWRDRDYNRDGGSTGFMFDSPMAVLNWSVPIWRLGGISIRLHFWLLLAFTFILMTALRTGLWVLAGLTLLAFFTALLLHEFGHYFAARFVGGRHDEFLIWPFGNMIPPTHPPQPWPSFAANVGGIVFNGATAAVAGTVLYKTTHVMPQLWADPLGMVGVTSSNGMAVPPGIFGTFLGLIYLSSLTLVLVNLLPFYWFDGAHLLQAVLQPLLGAYRAISVTCVTGMIGAGLLVMLALYELNLLLLLMAGLLFWNSMQRRQLLRANGPEVMEEFSAMGAGYSDLPPKERRRKLSQSWLRWMGRNAKQEHKDQEKIDRILDKVHEKGLHSLTWMEKRTLRKATQRQKARDMEARR